MTKAATLVRGVRNESQNLTGKPELTWSQHGDKSRSWWYKRVHGRVLRVRVCVACRNRGKGWEGQRMRVWKIDFAEWRVWPGPFLIPLVIDNIKYTVK